MQTEVLMSAALETYRGKVSLLKKGYEQERYRIEQISRSFLGALVVRQVTSVNIATYRDARLQELNSKTGKPISPATVRLEMSLLSNFFDICRIEWGYCDDNPVLKVRKPKPPPGRDRRLTPREDRQILRYSALYSNRELFSIVVIALESAMRQSEILGLTWENINLKTRIVHLPATKNGSKRDVPLSFKAKEALLRLGVKTEGKVFGYTKEGIKTTWRVMMQRLGIVNLHFHDMRHEACSRLFELGTLDVMEIAAITGHKSLAMLKRYTHLRAQRLVRKLEGNRNKGRQAIFDNLVPYPALVEEEDGRCEVRLLDFEGLSVVGSTLSEALRLAGDGLLRHIINAMKNGVERLPEPDEFLESVDQSKVVMIDPLLVQETLFSVE